jgi:hypothetical protein
MSHYALRRVCTQADLHMQHKNEAENRNLKVTIRTAEHYFLLECDAM